MELVSQLVSYISEESVESSEEYNLLLFRRFAWITAWHLTRYSTIHVP